MSFSKGIFIVSAKRTPFGAFGGKLANQTCVDLQEAAARAAIKEAKVSPEIIDSCIVGNVISCSSVDGVYLARHVALRLGCNLSTPSLVVNRLCGSGFQSLITASQEIQLGESSVALAGGTESMSQSPYILRNSRFGTRLGVDLSLEDSLWASLTDAHIKTPMAITAENLATKYNITREETDEFALASQLNWKKAQDEGRFEREIAPITIKVKRQDIVMNVDEPPKPQTTKEGLAKLAPVFKKGGVVTAGNASGISDGAGALIVASEEACKKHNLTPLAQVIGYSVVGCDPNIMGIGPVPAIRQLLDITKVRLEDIGVLEINEAFAAQTLACQKELKIDPNRLNTSGGAIALGHPLAASGSRILSHIVSELKRLDTQYGLGSACIGGGQGVSVLLKNC